MRRPRKFRHLVFTPARIAPSLRFHFQQHEIAYAALVETPGSAEPCDAAADDHNGNADLPCRRAKRSMVAKPMAVSERIVNKAAGNHPIGFTRQQQRGRQAQKLPPPYLATSFHSRS